MNTKRLILMAMFVTLGTLLMSACSAPPSNHWGGISADAERAYLSNGNFVYAIDLKSGNKVWQFPKEASGTLIFNAAPVLTADGQLLVGSAGSDHFLFSLDPQTGIEKWAEPFKQNEGAWMAAPLAFNDTIYAPNADGFLYRIDLQGQPAAAPLELGGALWSAPVTDGELVYVSSLDHHVHIINPADGSNSSVELGGASPSSPTPGEGGVYAGSFDFTIQFITPDGKMKDIVKAEDWIWGSPVVDNGTLYYADLKGNIISFDLASGKQNWVVTREGDAVVAGLLVAGERIYAAVEGKEKEAVGSLLALDRAGTIVWEKSLSGKIYTAPFMAGDLILVAPFQAEDALVAYDADGKQVWVFAPEK